MQFLMPLVDQYETQKILLSERFGLSESECHIHAGLLIYLGVALILRRPLSSRLPLIAVIFAEAINEGIDWLNHGFAFPPDTISDVIRTLIWPTAIYVVANLKRREPEPEPDAAPDPDLVEI